LAGCWAVVSAVESGRRQETSAQGALSSALPGESRGPDSAWASGDDAPSDLATGNRRSWVRSGPRLSPGRAEKW